MSTHRIGYAVSPDAVVALDTTWDGVANAPIPLTRVDADARSFAMLTAMLLGSLDLDIDTVAGGATTVQAMLTWDAAGTKVIAGPSGASTLWAGAGAPAGRSGTSILVSDRPAMAPGGIDPGIVYLWLRLDAGTANLSAKGARLNWHLPESG